MTTKNELAVLVLSCDKFSDAWDPFFKMFFNYWPDCPHPVYLCTETRVYENERVITVKPGKELGWSARLQWALQNIPEEYIIFLLEDYILLKPVSNNRIEHHFNVLKETKSCYLRLFPCPGPDESLKGHPGIGVIRPGSPYRNCTQAAIWKKDAILSIIDPNESVWDFELIGVKRADHIDGMFLSVEVDEKGDPLEEGDYPITYYCTAINRGKWRREAVKIIRRHGFDVDLKARPQETRKEMYKRILLRKYLALRGISPIHT
jgi:hypothetical protein